MPMMSEEPFDFNDFTGIEKDALIQLRQQFVVLSMGDQPLDDAFGRVVPVMDHLVKLNANARTKLSPDWYPGRKR